MQAINEAYQMLIRGACSSHRVFGVVISDSHRQAAHALNSALNNRLPRGHPARQAIGNLRAHIAALQPQVFRRLADVFHSVLNIVASATERDELIHGRRSWADLGWKAMSMKGFDVRQDKTLDYGNYEYRCLSRVLCLAYPSLLGQLARLSRFWPTLHPDQLDCDNVVEMQGDLVEILFAALRGEAYFQPWLGLHIYMYIYIYVCLCQW